MEFTQTMFEYDFDVTPQHCLTLKAMTAEELYEMVIVSIDEVVSFTHESPYRKKPYDKLTIHMGELFRRNMTGDLSQVYLEKIMSDGPWGLSADPQYYIKAVKTWCVKQIKLINFFKETTMTLLKAPLLSKQINDLMDEILDKNGNKPSQFKDFLTPEHYRKVRMGCDISEWSVDEQELLLASVKKM